MSKVLVRCAFCILFLSLGVFASEEGEDSVSVQDNETLNFVLATDIKYAVPTAVAIHSIERSVTGKKFIVIIVDESRTQERIDKLLLAKDNIHFLDLSKIERRLSHSDHGALSKVTEKFGKDKLMAIRLFLPTIPGDHEEGEKEMTFHLNHFLWLDSDLIITEDIRPFYVDLLRGGFDSERRFDKNQPVFSANYKFIKMEPDAKYTVDPRTRKYSFTNEESGELGACNDSPRRISGGVVLWDLTKWKSAINQVRCSLNIPGRITYGEMCINRSQQDDESFLSFLLKQVSNDDQYRDIYCFSTRYNCRSAYVDAAKQFLQDKTLKMSNAAREDLQAISEGRVAIWHWDYERKPWDYGSEETVGFPEALWWAYLRDLASKLDAAGLEIITSWRPNYQLCGLLRVSEAGLAISSNPRIPANGFFIGLGSSSRKILRSTSMPNIRPKSALK